jgi:ribonuclease Z
LAYLNAGILFDIGYVHPSRTKFQKLFLTHFHMDHSAGLPYLISQRSLQHLAQPDIYIPQVTVEDCHELLKVYSRLEGFEYKYNLIGMSEGSEIEINKSFVIKSWNSFHRIPSFGYTGYEKKLKLKEELKGATKDQLMHLREDGVEIQEIKLEPIFSFSGDAKIEYISNHEDVRKSKVIFMECTYIDDKRDVARAREWGHTHLDEIVALSEQLECEKLVLIHFSRRYSKSTALATIEKKLPKDLFLKTELLWA